MSAIKRFFVEFKSIFTGEDVLKENEEHANVVTATTMLNMFIVCLLTFILTHLNIFSIENKLADGLLIRAIFLFLIPAVICFILKGKGKWLKYILFIFYVSMLAVSDAILKFNITLVMVVPLVLASRYYDKKFTIRVSFLISIAFFISAFIGINYGVQDLNSYNLVISEGTTITVNSTLQNAVKELNIDETQRTYDIIVHLFLPKYLVYLVVAFACIQVSQSGKKMIERQKELSEEGARIESELNLARGIQKNMLPSTFPAFPEHKEIDIYANMIPAKEVGGDFYDMFLIDDDHLAVTIADVSGKGVPAALIMMISRKLIKNTALNKYSVDEAFYKVNNLMCEDNAANNFVTSWFGILDLKTGNMEYVNAGHNAPLIYKKKNKKFEFIKDKPNLVLAGMENTKYTKHDLKLDPGDRLFLYTDGVVEATSVNKELYGDDRLYNYLNSNINKTLNDTIKDLKMDIDNFVGKEKQFDDITMLELLFKDYKKETKEEKEFKADISNLDDVLSYLDDYLNKYNVSKKIIKQMELVVEELFVNVCSYAYEKDKGYFKLSLNYSNDIFEMIMEDEGIKFNPLERIDPDITLSSEDRNIGGLGILLAKKNMDNIKYKRKDNKNILVLEKNVKEEK